MIVHIDVDSFYCQCEYIDNSSLRGRPVVVSQHNTGGFVAVSALAKAAGIRKADGVGAGGRANIPWLRDRISREEACAKCPGLVIVEMDMPRYKRHSKALLQSLEEFAGSGMLKVDVQQTSIDDFYFDLDLVIRNLTVDTTVERNRWFRVVDPAVYPPVLRAYETGDPFLVEMCAVQMLRSHVLQRTGFEVSVGIASNKLIARLVSPLKKPNAQVCIAEADNEQFISHVPITRIPTLQGKLGAQMEADGFSVCADLRHLGVSDLSTRYCRGNGKKAQWIWNAVRGDAREQIKKRGPAKSIIVERSFYKADVAEIAELLCSELLNRVAEDGRTPAKMDVRWRVGYGKGGEVRLQSKSAPWTEFSVNKVLSVLNAPHEQLTRLVVGASGFLEKTASRVDFFRKEAGAPSANGDDDADADSCISDLDCSQIPSLETDIREEQLFMQGPPVIGDAVADADGNRDGIERTAITNTASADQEAHTHPTSANANAAADVSNRGVAAQEPHRSWNVQLYECPNCKLWVLLSDHDEHSYVHGKRRRIL
eukprot:ANDGO_02281.mRNA.1 DNA polymerase eta